MSWPDKGQNKGPDKESGAVLITTLLVMALMAALAVAFMDDIRFAVKRTINIQAYAQADWYVRGAEDFADAYLDRQLSQTSLQDMNTALSTMTPVIFPFEGGAMQLTVRDGSQCLSLGALSSAPGRRLFRQLLTNLGWSQTEAASLTSIAIDWQDADQQVLPGGAEDYTYLGLEPAYRTADTEFSSITELRALKTMTEDKYEMIRPFVCARPSAQPSGININTLPLTHAVLLQSLLGETISISTAVQIIQERPAAGYENLEALLSLPALEGLSQNDANLDLLVFTPEHIWIEADIDYLTARRTAAFEFSIDGNAAKVLSRQYSDEAKRPVLTGTSP